MANDVQEPLSKCKSEVWVTACGGSLLPQERDKILTRNRGRDGSQDKASEKHQSPWQWVRAAAWEPDDGRWHGPQMVRMIFPIPQVLIDSGVRGWQVVARTERLCYCLGQGKSPSSLGERECSTACVSNSQGRSWCVGIAENKKPRLLTGSVQ